MSSLCLNICLSMHVHMYLYLCTFLFYFQLTQIYFFERWKTDRLLWVVWDGWIDDCSIFSLFLSSRLIFFSSPFYLKEVVTFIWLGVMCTSVWAEFILQFHHLSAMHSVTFLLSCFLAVSILLKSLLLYKITVLPSVCTS